MMLTKTRKWGNSLGVIIPKDAARRLKLRENQDVILDIKPRENPLKELFGFAKGKINKPAEDILKDARKNLSKHF